MNLAHLLYKEASVRVNTHKDACRVLFAEDSRRIDSLSKKGMSLNKGGVWQRRSTNVFVKQFPYEDRPQIAKIRDDIIEAFSPQLVQHMKLTSGMKAVKLDLTALGVSPFYIRYSYVTKIIPPGKEEAILPLLDQVHPELKDMVQKMEAFGVAPMPYYNKHEGTDNAAFLSFAQQMAQTYSKDPQQKKLAEYWSQIAKKAAGGQKTKADWRTWHTVQLYSYDDAVTESMSNIDKVRVRKHLLAAIRFAESPGNTATKPNKYPV